MISVVALYFKSKWHNKCLKKATKTETFTNTKGVTSQLPIMNQTATFPYAEDEKYQHLMMPYEDDRVSMVIVLHKDPKFYPKMDLSQLPAFKNTRVELKLPRFSQRSKLDLEGLSNDLGIRTAFTPDADFSGITGDKTPLFVSKIV